MRKALGWRRRGARAPACGRKGEKEALPLALSPPLSLCFFPRVFEASWAPGDRKGTGEGGSLAPHLWSRPSWKRGVEEEEELEERKERAAGQSEL